MKLPLAAAAFFGLIASSACGDGAGRHTVPGAASEPTPTILTSDALVASR